MFKNKEFISFGSLIIAATIFMFVFYGKVILSPNEYIFGGAGDGLKNYYTFTYHASHDSDFMEFEGMNYPYGENVLYTDGHPLLSWVFQLLHISNDVHVGFINLLMLFAIWFNFIVLFLLLKKLNVERWFAVIGALCIALLQPQIFRLTGHYALSYPFAIPLAWYLILKIKESDEKWKWIAAFTLINLMWMFTHAYLGMIVLFFAGSYLMFDLFFTGKKDRIQSLSILGIAVLFPIIFFKIFAVVSDVHLDRTGNPMGFFDYYGSFKEIFIPIMGPMKDWISNVRGKDFNLNYEAASYVGMWTMISLLIASLIWLWSTIKRKVIAIPVFLKNRPVMVALVASIPVLLFSFSWPFRGNPDWLDHLSVLKQFRATGRFAWVFYYALSIFAIHSLSTVLKSYLNEKLSSKIVVYSVGVIMLVLTVYESEPFHSHISERITQTKNEFSSSYLSKDYRNALKQIDPDEYQAILPLPFFHYGSENFHRPRQHFITKHSFVLSQHTGLPLFGAFLTRVSIPESKNLVQMMGPVTYPKLVQADIQDDLDILIIASNEELTKNEKHLLPRKSFYENESLKLYRISLIELFEMRQDEKKFSDSFLNLLSERLELNEWYHEDTSSFFYFNEFENNQSEVVFKGESSLSFPKAGTYEIDRIPVDSLKKGTSYTLSVWMYNDGNDVLNQWFDIRVRERYALTGEWKETVAYPEQAEVIWGNWSLVEFDFIKQIEDSELIIETRGRERSKATITIDDLMIREKDISHYRFINKEISYFTGDNQWLVFEEEIE